MYVLKLFKLGIAIQNAFDDLDDDETTVDSTTHSQFNLADGNASALQLPQGQNQQRKGNPYGNLLNNCFAGATDQPTEQSHYEKQIHELQMIVEHRSHELEHAKQLLEEESKKNNELGKKLIISEAELDRALRSKNNNHDLLVESKEKISNLENTIGKIRHEREVLETEKNDLLGKLETAQTLLSDVQRKYDMVKRDLNKNEEKEFEIKRKQMEERHRAAITLLEQKMEQLGEELNKKSGDLKNMNSRYEALQQSHQTMLCDNDNKISVLSHALDKSQKQCQELLLRPDYNQENIRLQKLVASLQAQILDMEKTINNLRQRLEITTAELDSMDNQADDSRRLSQTMGRIEGSTPLNTIDRVNNLKTELCRALENIKSKRAEVRKLQQSLDDKQEEIKQLKQEENEALVQISTLREENIKLENKLKVLQQEFDQLAKRPDPITQHDSNLVLSLQEQLEEVKKLITLEKQKSNELERCKMQQEADRKKLDAQYKNLKIDLEELKQEHESLKLNYEQILKENISLKQRQTADNMRLELEKQKFLLKDSQAECDRLKNLYVEISNAKEALSYEFEKLRNSDAEKDLQDEKEKVANLQRALKLAEVKCSELSKILETDKLRHEREQADLRDKLEKVKAETSKANKDTANECVKCLDYVAELTKVNTSLFLFSPQNCISLLKSMIFYSLKYKILN